MRPDRLRSLQGRHRYDGWPTKRGGVPQVRGRIEGAEIARHRVLGRAGAPRPMGRTHHARRRHRGGRALRGLPQSPIDRGVSRRRGAGAHSGTHVCGLNLRTCRSHVDVRYIKGFRHPETRNRRDVRNSALWCLQLAAEKSQAVRGAISQVCAPQVADPYNQRHIFWFKNVEAGF